MKGIKYLIVFLSVVFATNSIVAQTSKEERDRFREMEREKRQSDREKDRSEKISLQMLQDEEKDKDFDITEVPAKWKNESAVILCQKYNYQYTNGVFTPGTLHLRRRIKIQNQSALEDFVTIYTELELSKKDKLVIAVVKPDGKINIITPKDAIKVGNKEFNKIPSIYRGRSNDQTTYYKVAIPDLEVGDILDIRSEQQLSAISTTVYFQLPQQYPIVKQELIFELHRSYCLAYRSLNGAPKVVPYSTDERKSYGYRLVDSNREKYTDSRWLYEMRQLPSIKFYIVTFASNSLSVEFMPEKEKPLTSINERMLKEKVEVWYGLLKDPTVDYTFTLFEKDMKSAVGKDYASKMNDEELLESFYYSLRKNGTYGNGRILTRTGIPIVFLTQMMKFFKKFDYPYEIVICPIRKYTGREDLLFFHEICFAIKYKNHLIFPPTPTSNFGDIHEMCQGQDCYVIKILPSGLVLKTGLVYKDTIPVAEHKNNMYKSAYHVSISNDYEKLSVTDTTMVKGILKSDMLDYYPGEETSNQMFKKEDESLFNYTEDENKRSNNARREESERKEKQILMDEKTTFLKNSIERLENDYGKGNVESVNSYEILKTGRTQKADTFVYTQSFSLNNYINKVGDNYTLDLGKIIGSQVQIKEDEKNRNYDIFLDNARIIYTTTTLDIPQGYKIEGIDKFTTNIDNNTGSFQSTAEIQGNKLVINTIKTYKNIYFSKSDWSKMIEFLDAAYNFTQKKVVLKKI